MEKIVFLTVVALLYMVKYYCSSLNLQQFKLKIMSRNLLLYVVLISPFVGQSQVLKIQERTTLVNIENATVYNAAKTVVLYSNKMGEVDLSNLRGENSIYISKQGYLLMHFSYAKLEELKFVVGLSEATYNMDEVVVSANKFQEKRSDAPQQIQVIKPNDLAFINQSTSADVLQQTGNVFVQKSQLGGGSPVIRGFEANKVLLVLDGVRLNNAIYRGGHLQNVLSVDNAMLEKLEIVFGPNSVIYGSDALGGVMHFHTKNPELAYSNKMNFSVNSFVRHGTSSDENSGHFNLNLGFKNIAFLSSITYSDFGDLRQGANRNPFYGNFGKCVYYAQQFNGLDSMLANGDVNMQRRTGYDQIDLLQKILIRQNKYVTHVFNFQSSITSNINRYDRLSDMSSGILKYAEWYYGPQKRNLSSYSLNLNKANRFYNQARMVVAFQNIEESRHDRKFAKTLLNHRTERVEVFSINADFNKISKRNELRYGFEICRNSVRSTAYSEDIQTGNIGALDTRYPDGGSKMNTQAAYLSHTFELNSKIKITEGIRFNYVLLDAKFVDKTFFPFPINEVQQNYSSLNGNLGLVYLPQKDWRFSAVFSTGFRAPNIDDLAKVFESVPGKLIIPNPNLKPEKTYNGEVGITKIINQKIKLEGNIFYTLLKRAISIQNSSFEGQDSILYGGVKSAVQTSVNNNEAFVYGFSGGIAADITDGLSFVTTLNYTYGRIKTDSINYPLDHIAPVFGRTGLNIKLKKCKMEFFAIYNGWKRIENYNLLGEDNIAYATINGTPAWFTLNYRAAYQLNSQIQLQLAIENILDQNYRVFASGISAPGRNFVATLRGNF